MEQDLGQVPRSTRAYPWTGRQARCVLLSTSLLRYLPKKLRLLSPFPQWNVTEEPQENGDIHIIIDDGNVIWRYTDAEGIDHGEVFTCVGQDFGVKEKTGTIVWVLKELYSAGTVDFIEGEVAPQEDWLAYVPLAVVIVDEDISFSTSWRIPAPMRNSTVSERATFSNSSAGYIITQKHGDSIFMSDSGTPVDVLASEDKVVRIAGEDGASSQYRIVVDPITEDGKIKFYVGITQLDENGEPVAPDPPPASVRTSRKSTGSRGWDARRRSYASR